MCHDSGLEDEKVWGEMETGLCLEGAVGLTSEADEMVEDSGMGSEIDGEKGIDGKVTLMTTEPEPGAQMDTGKGACGEAMSEPGARADWKLDRGGEGEIVSRGADGVPTSPHPSVAPCQEEEESEVMEEEPSGTEKRVEVVMDTAEVNSLQCEELSHRC